NPFGLLYCRRIRGRSLAVDGIDALADQLQRLLRLPARGAERHLLDGAEAHVSSAALDLESEDPRLRTALGDLKIQAAAVREHAWGVVCPYFPISQARSLRRHIHLHDG